MIVFASVEAVGTALVKCEVESVPAGPRQFDEIVDNCEQLYVDISLFFKKGITPMEGDVYKVVLENGNVMEICGIDVSEKMRRISFLNSLNSLI